MAKKKIFLLVFGLFLYSWRLWGQPAYLNQDEAMFALNAKSIATLGRDFYGNSLPFYFWHLDSFWATPVVVYWTSIFFKILPFNEFVARFSSVVLTIVSVGLIMYLANIVFKNKNLSFLAGVLFLLTPALFINSRLLLDNIYPIIFVIVSLIFLTKEKYFWLGLTLGLGVHSYHAAKIYMPIYLLGLIFYNRSKKWWLIILGFLLPVISLIKYPDFLLNQIGYAKSIDNGFSFTKIGEILIRYISYFNPKILFISGDKSLIHSTGSFGVFVFPIIFLFVFGILEIFKTKDKFGKLLFLGFLIYPMAPSLINDPERISRALVVIPFVVLMSVYGIRFLYKSKEKILKKFLYLNLIFVLLTFILFLANYFGRYQRDKVRLFNYNIGGTIESVIRSTKIRNVKNIYVDKNIFFVKYYVEFYELKNNVFIDPIYINPERIENYEKGSIIVLSKKQDLKNFELIETIREPDGVESYFVYFRDSNK